MATKSFGEKVMGIFVERDEPTPATAPTELPKSPKARAPAPRTPPTRPEPARANDVERAIVMVESLPPDTPLETQRTIAIAALRAFGISTDDILVAADAELATVQHAIDEARQKHAEIMRDGHTSIERLRAKVAEMEALLASQQTALAAAEDEARAKSARVRRMRAFFGSA